MSVSNEWAEWHLTRDGWQRGDERMDFTPRKDRPVPDGRVLTVRFTEKIESRYSQTDRWLRTVWRDSNDKLVEELLRKHGECPQQL